MAAVVGRRLEHIADGELASRAFAVRFWDGSTLPATVASPAEVTLVVRDVTALAQVMREPNEVGLARAWATGALDVDGDIESALSLAEPQRPVKLGIADRAACAALLVWLAGPGSLLGRLPRAAVEARLRGRRHSRERDRAAIAHHYDVPEAFFATFLGASMVYSCAVFATPDESLEVAQMRKLDRICRKLALRDGDRLLDIGCGWGALVAYAAEHYGVEALGITLSAPQASYAEREIAARGLAGRCEVRHADYRDLAGLQFDAIASVGMYEHVGLSELGGYVAAVSRMLRPGGLFLNHGIASLRSRRAPSPGFFDHFIFPDGELHPLARLADALQQHGLEQRDVESLREHYALTLRSWGRNLDDHHAEAVAIGGAERVRIWRLYLAASAYAFATGRISVFQTLASRPGGPPSRLPLLRERIYADDYHSRPARVDASGVRP